MIINLVMESLLRTVPLLLVICVVWYCYTRQVQKRLEEVTKQNDYLDSRIRSLEIEIKYLKETTASIINHKEEKIIVPLIDPNTPRARFNSEGCIIEESRENLEDISNIEDLED